MSKKKLIGDICVGGLLALFSALMIWAIIPKQISTNLAILDSANIGVTSQTFPIFACAIFGISALGLVATSVVKLVLECKKNAETKVESGEEKETFVNWKEELGAMKVFAMCVLYGILYATIGFIVATCIVVPLTLFLLGSRDWKHYVALLVLAVVMYCIFKYGLNVRIP